MPDAPDFTLPPNTGIKRALMTDIFDMARRSLDGVIDDSALQESIDASKGELQVRVVSSRSHRSPLFSVVFRTQQFGCDLSSIALSDDKVGALRHVCWHCFGRSTGEQIGERDSNLGKQNNERIPLTDCSPSRCFACSCVAFVKCIVACAQTTC